MMMGRGKEPFSWNLSDMSTGIEVRNPYLVGGGSVSNMIFTSLTQPTGRGFGEKNSGKWQYSVNCIVGQSGSSSNSRQTTARFGICLGTKSLNETLGVAPTDYAIGFYNGDSDIIFAVNNDSSILNGGVLQASPATVTIGSIFTILVDFDDGKMWFARQGVVYGSGNPELGTGQTFDISDNTYYPACGFQDNSINTSGQYQLLTQAPYSSWPSFDLWDM